MKRHPLFILVSILLGGVLPAAAQCGMYTYRDLWLDDTGNAVGVNYTEAASCDGASSYAQVTVTMPSGSRNVASASGTCCAEAITESSSTAQEGEGVLAGFNEVWDSCGNDVTSSDEWPVDFELAYTKSKWDNTYTTLLGGAVRCFVSSWCTAGTTPPTCDPSSVDQYPSIPGQQASCWRYYKTNWMAVRIRITGWPWKCFPLLPGENAFGTTDSSAMVCTKL